MNSDPVYIEISADEEAALLALAERVGDALAKGVPDFDRDRVFADVQQRAAELGVGR